MSTSRQDGSAKKINWEIAKECIAELNRLSPGILQQGVVIGGIACWFFRNLLDKANDPDFRVPQFSPSQEELWLSKDIDFTNFFAQDARDLLKDNVVPDAQGRLHIQVAGVPIGFAQVGLTFDPESAWAESWIVSFPSAGITVQCRILDPISLYREKQALSQRRGSESDRMHFDLLAEFLKFEICNQASALASADSLEKRTPPLKFLLSIRDRAPESAQDNRVSSRIKTLLKQSETLAPSERDLLTDLCSS